MERMTVTLVTGANRGIGREIARQLAEDHGHHVLLGARDLERGRAVAGEIGGSVEAIELDVTDLATIEALAARLDALDVLVNNAGVELEAMRGSLPPDWATVERTLDVNLLGPWRMTATMAPLLRRSPHPRIVNVSSSSGLLDLMEHDEGGAPGYRVSKVGLNALTKIWTRELPEARVNAACPGWIRTDMGGNIAPLPVERGAAGLVWLATLPDDGPTGRFFRFGSGRALAAASMAEAEVPF
jgi:NAD(P)-dependent dehydrogenase (short-subunit alcohol dehydrogenase family)